MKTLAAFAALLLAVPVHAATGYYMVTTYPVEGQKSVDFKYWNAHPSGLPGRNSPELGLGYNVTSRWYTEVTAAWFQLNPGPLRYSAVEWQNDVMLTQGQYDIDVALHSKVVFNRDGARGKGVEFGPVMQTEIGRTQFNLNLFLQKDVDVARSQPVQLAYQLQVKHRFTPMVHLGVQAFGEVGEWKDWLPSSQQSHRAGPAVFGEVGKVRYEAAYLMGKNNARAAKTFSMRVQYLF
jgi:hypothetical protein